LLKLHIDFYGYYDFDLNRLEFAARLREDSHVVKLPLSGMLLVRAEFGDKPTFILSAGGFHSKFKDLPAGLPCPIDRLAVKLSIGRFSVVAQQYFAITPATIQIGADFHVKAKIGPVSLNGGLGYEALLYLEPRFFFEVDIHGEVAVEYKGRDLASVKIDLHLEGPGRWRASGKVTFSIWIWDISKSFDEAWGDDPPIAPRRTNVAQLMEKALLDKGNWRVQQPIGGEPFVTLEISDAAGKVLAHPLGQLHVSQKVAPLGLELERFGSTRIEGPNKFEITSVSVGTGADKEIKDPPTLTEFFARAQFLDTSEKEKLSAPSFEKFISGINIGTDQYAIGDEIIAKDIMYDTFYLHPDEPVQRIKDPKATLGLSRLMLLQQAQHGAAAKSGLRTRASLRPKATRKVKLQDPPLVVTDTDTNKDNLELKALAQSTRSLATQHMRATLGNKAAVTTHHIVEAFELVT
jgi:hypothetical protein